MSANKSKIFDILPPKDARNKRKPSLIGEPKKIAKVFNIDKQVSFTAKTVRDVATPRVVYNKKVAFLGAFILLTILAVGLYVKLLEVRVYVWPKQESWEFQEKIVIETGTNTMDVAAKRIPGRIIEDTYETFRQFQSSGETAKDAKAKGVIRAYNKYQLPQVLIAGTRFLSADGKLFRSARRVSIASGSYQDVEVEAAESGEAYNIEPTTFSLPGLAGTPRYTSVYGESLAPMAGGSASKVPQVTGEDIKKAEDSVSRSLTEEGKRKLLGKVDGTQTIILNDSISQEIVEVASLVSEGAQVPSFQVKGKVVSRALIFENSSLDEFIKGVIVAQLGSEKKLNEASVKIDPSVAQINWHEERLELNVAVSASLYPPIEDSYIITNIIGKDVKAAKNFLEQNQSIAKYKIEFWPLPARSIPRDTKRIDLEFRL